MSQSTNDSRMRSLIRYHFQRNRHLTAVHDVDDLFQDAWIDLNHPRTEQPDAEEVSHEERVTQEQALRHAVGRAAERAFGKLRKRNQRGSAAEVRLEFEPADCLPDYGLVLDLKQQIESLPSEERVVIEMLRSGFEGTEIAERLKLSPQAVTRRKQRALERLRNSLGQPT